ncbi:STAS-like domain-containing protein [Clostridium sp. MSJ-4]|uniref:STAS-like domain-containing protein n=1 Tax=Clostridium simiarum TaxID=2841506 RepID=A0ABS6F110_9CLOT|nr:MULTISPECIES: STAS-like domain-containing protein [Clostridium]MBU5592189.1 STAS-like domain-containing protein [Clostridium simiarum]
MNIKVKDIIGTNFENEDAIVLREYIKQHIGAPIMLDFSDIDKVSTSFLCCLFTDLINSEGRDYIAANVDVKNLSNTRDLRRVLLGTAF